jgi:hypothetical protein
MTNKIKTIEDQQSDYPEDTQLFKIAIWSGTLG